MASASLICLLASSSLSFSLSLVSVFAHEFDVDPQAEDTHTRGQIAPTVKVAICLH